MKYKFRAKNKDSGKWEYGYYVKYIKRQVSPIGDFLKETDVVHLIFQSGFADWNMERPLNAVEVIPETVGQYSGFLDGNGKMIYEGDEIRLFYGECCQGVHEYDKTIVLKDIRFDLEEISYADYIGVIGNIHDKENK